MSSPVSRLDQLKDLLEKEPFDSFLRHALALEYLKRDDNEAARRQFEELLDNDPEYVGSYYHLGKTCEKLGDYHSAIKWYKRGMEVAKQLKHNRNYNEIKNALEELED